MPGAMLEAAGQVRSAYPYIVHRTVAANLLIVDGGAISNVIAPLSYAFDVPFDRGPDKSGRVFVVFNGVSVMITAGAYAAAAQVVGNLYYRSSSNSPLHLMAFADFIPNAIVKMNDRIFTPIDALFGSPISNIGSLHWVDQATVVGASDLVTLRCTLNVGFYAEYAEFNFDRLHEEIHNIPKHMHTIDLTPQ